MSSFVTSHEIGVLFEKASVKMLELLFTQWGYRIEELRRQKSGTQHGFDIHLKVYNDNFQPMHVFVECKGSATIKSIDKRELDIKSEQLERSTFIGKDVHLFFSPTRWIDYSSDELSIEQIDYPFCVVDMMHKKDGSSEILDLFLAYDGNDADIVTYRSIILEPAVKGRKSLSGHIEICELLKRRYFGRLESFFSNRSEFDFTLFTSSYWNFVKSGTDKKRLKDYYLRLDSTTNRLKEVVANSFHVENKNAKESLRVRINELEQLGGGLITITSNGGSGKSTFLIDVGKDLSERHLVFYVEKWTGRTLKEIRKQVGLLQVGAMPIILFDNIANYFDDLYEYSEEIANYPNGVICVVAERSLRYDNLQRIRWFETLFANRTQINLENAIAHSEIFSRFFGVLNTALENRIDSNTKEYLFGVFTSDVNFSLAERLIAVLKAVSKNDSLIYKFDWVEWSEVHRGTPLEYLYTIVAAFYQFGLGIEIDFCLSFKVLSSISRMQIIEAIGESRNHPIIRIGDKLLLRHEKLAEWYIEEEEKQEVVKAIHKEWLDKINPRK